MHKGLEKIIVISIVTFVFAVSADAQIIQKFSLSIAAGMSKTGSIGYNDSYRQYSSSPIINIEKAVSSRNNNYNFSIGYQAKKSLTINGSIGVSSYGFQYSGDIAPSRISTVPMGGFSIKETYTTRLMEVGLTASYRIPYKNDLAFIIQPGVAWYTNPKEEISQTLGIFMNSNNYSATFFTGIEIPITVNSFSLSIGVNTKVALNNFAWPNEIETNFRPYALGLQTAITYRFGAYNFK